MNQTVNFTDFCDAWRSHDRNDSFTYEGKLALFDWLEAMEEEIGEEWELDVVSLDCDFSEHESATDCLNDHGYDYEYVSEDDTEREDEAREYLRENTQLLEFSTGIIIQGF